MPHIYLPVQVQRLILPPVLPNVPSHRLSDSQPTPPQRVKKEVSTAKPLLSTPPVQNKSTPKTRNKTKKVTPPNDNLQRPFSARILRSRLYHYGKKFNACAEDYCVSQHLL